MIRQAVRWFRQRYRLTDVTLGAALAHVDFGRAPCTILDVGANRGGFASQMLLRAPLATVHCFEPNPELVAVLRKNALGFGRNKSGPRCRVIEAAAGPLAGQAELIITQFDAASSLLSVASSSRQGWPSVDFEERRRATVDVIRLDDWLDAQGIEAVKLLKLDVQGFELDALKGCARRLCDVDYIYAEVQFVALYEGAPVWNEIVAYLRGFGFEAQGMDAFCFAPDGSPLQADLLLRRI